VPLVAVGGGEERGAGVGREVGAQHEDGEVAPTTAAGAEEMRRGRSSPLAARRRARRTHCRSTAFSMAWLTGSGLLCSSARWQVGVVERGRRLRRCRGGGGCGGEETSRRARRAAGVGSGERRWEAEGARGRAG
jgi:hypothetical protein